MGSVATINVDYARIADFDQTIPLDQKPLNSLNFTRYGLYNRDFAGQNFKLEDHAYLSYEGGFVTQGDRVNFKKSDLLVRPSTTTGGGNFFVSGSSTFFSNINLISETGTVANTVRNIRRLETLTELNGTEYNKDAISLGDFKRFFYQPGMIVFYNGTWENLRDNMPFWRICAAPDAGSVVSVKYANNTTGQITVPNLLGKFIPGAGYTGSNYNIGNTGGSDAIKISLDQVPIHKHDVAVTVTGDEPPVFSSNPLGVNTFYSGGGAVVPSYSSGRDCTYKSATCECRCTCNTSCRCRGTEDSRRDCGSGCGDGRRCWTSQGYRGARTSYNGVDYRISAVTAVTIDSYTFKKLKFVTQPPTVSQTEQIKGENVSHENRPRFYGLIPIIYVGVRR